MDLLSFPFHLPFVVAVGGAVLRVDVVLDSVEGGVGGVDCVGTLLPVVLFGRSEVSVAIAGWSCRNLAGLCLIGTCFFSS